jgi:aspartate/methionine/tyrosine aminotransferase
MHIAPFATELFFSRYEFSTPYQLCNSDCESLTVDELLSLAGEDIASLGHQRLGYVQSEGPPELRAAIAATYASVREEEVLVLGSPVEGIYLAARALLNPGDEVIVLCPASEALIILFDQVVGAAHVRRWTFAPGTKGWDLRLEDLERLFTARTKLVVVNFPHNPTGFLPSPDMQHAILRLAADHQAWLFYDEMYYGLVHAGTPPIPSAADLSDRSIVLSGLSKTYGLPGLRCGGLVVKDADLRDRLLNWKFYTSICPPGPTAYLATVALRVHDALRQRSLRLIETNLRLAEEFFARWPDRFEWRPPAAGSTALVGFRVPSVSELSDTLAREEGVLVQSGAMLGSDDQHMRIGYGRAGFGEALARFERWLRRTG